MDSNISTKKGSGPLRRSRRQSVSKVLTYEATPRAPLMRSKSGTEGKRSAKSSTGLKVVDNGLDDEVSPTKKRRLETDGADGASGDEASENKMDFEELEEEMENNVDQEMCAVENSTHAALLPKINEGAIGDMNLSPCVLLGQRCRLGPTKDAHRVKLKNAEPKAPISPTKSTLDVRAQELRQSAPTTRSMADYKATMEAKAKSIDSSLDVPQVNRFPTRTATSLEKANMTRQRVNSIHTQTNPIPLKTQGVSVGPKKTAVNKGKPATSCRKFLWYLCQLVFLLLLLGSATLLAYTVVPLLNRTENDGTPPPRGVTLEKFTKRLLLLKTQFPSQQPELWERSKVYLTKYLEKAHPTQPASMILAGSLEAEGTLRCLSQGLASSFSSAFNASVLHVDGASKAGQDSDEVKLDLDEQLQAAFEGDQLAAVIHRFEALPPGSTLIFYRYCDHENAAYKQALLLFTVLLPQDELNRGLPLKQVEEIVHDYIEKRFVSSANETAFNEMDRDKFGGLWSRISHLVLPVVSEEEFEHKVCSI